MKIYEIIRYRSSEIGTAKRMLNKDVAEILIKWFPEYKVDFHYPQLKLEACPGYWCRFSLSGAETFENFHIPYKESPFRLMVNKGLEKREITSIKERLTKLYEGAYEDE